MTNDEQHGDSDASTKAGSGDHPAVKSLHATLEAFPEESRQRAQAIRARLSARLAAAKAT